MNQIAIALALTLSLGFPAVLASMANIVVAKSPSDREQIDLMAKAVADAYLTKELGKIDRKYPAIGKITISIEHSLGEEPNREVKEFKTFAQGDRWLKSKEHSELPQREIRPSIGCKKGLCTYNFDGGILHSHLYLQKVAYSYHNNRPYVKTIYLLNGD